LPLGIFADSETDSYSISNSDLNVGLPAGTVIESPKADPAAGAYSTAQNVKLSASGSHSIRYTIDGTMPACSGTGILYAGPIAISASRTIKAIACYGNNDSFFFAFR